MRITKEGYPGDMVPCEDAIFPIQEETLLVIPECHNSSITKTCVMCRKEIDSGALLCSYCNSKTDYQYFKLVSSDQLTSESHTTKSFIRIIIALLAITGCFGLGFMLGGFWIGAGVAVVIGKISMAFGEDSPTDVYRHHFCCPGCAGKQDVTWGTAKFDEFKSGFMECGICHKKTMVAVM